MHKRIADRFAHGGRRVIGNIDPLRANYGASKSGVSLNSGNGVSDDGWYGARHFLGVEVLHAVCGGFVFLWVRRKRDSKAREILLRIRAQGKKTRKRRPKVAVGISCRYPQIDGNLFIAKA